MVTLYQFLPGKDLVGIPIMAIHTLSISPAEERRGDSFGNQPDSSFGNQRHIATTKDTDILVV